MSELSSKAQLLCYDADIVLASIVDLVKLGLPAPVIVKLQRLSLDFNRVCWYQRGVRERWSKLEWRKHHCRPAQLLVEQYGLHAQMPWLDDGDVLYIDKVPQQGDAVTGTPVYWLPSLKYGG